MTELPNPVTLLLIVALVGFAPALVVLGTSFIKIVIVLSLIRNALGVQQIPPNMVLNGIAIILTLFIMAPVASASFRSLQGINLSQAEMPQIMDALSTASNPYRDFLSQHSSESEKAFFVQTAQRLWPAEMRDGANADNLLILMPAFTVSELTTAFKIGFLIYLPFIAIDLIISNILLAMGMMMVSPMTISLPFKLLLFVTLNGWTRLIHGLVLTYQ